MAKNLQVTGDLSAKDIGNFKFAPITLVNVKKSFSK